MVKKAKASEMESESLNSGAINPFALTEVVLGRRVNWKRMTDPRKLVEETLETSFDDLLDPATSPILFMGTDSPYVAHQRVADAVPEAVAKVAPAVVDAPFLSEMGIPRVERQVEGANGDYTPPGAVWRDPGDFLEDETEMSDPIQGGLGDCYFIAALASVAWARPYVIANRNRTRGTGALATFWDMIEFYSKPGATPDRIDVTEFVPMTPGGSYFYAHSSDPDEIWPAIYEKAYARWKTDGTDKPNYPSIAGGSSLWAMVELTGLKGYSYSNPSLSAAQILSRIRENCRMFIFQLNKTLNPMTAWTYQSAADAPDKIDYAAAGISAKHAYSILGLHSVNHHDYIILRNPWGWAEAKIDTVSGTWIANELPIASDAYRFKLDLGLVDGVFALGVDTFKKYFAGFGVVK